MSFKESVLDYLERNHGQDVSGEELARRLGVSRNMIWKTIKALKEDDYMIEAANNRGYRLCGDTLSEQGIRAYLGGQKNLSVNVYREIDSTNAEAKRRLAEGTPTPALFIADCQTAGRGRRGRDFFSPAGTGLYMTLAVTPAVGLRQAVKLTGMAAVAVSEAIEALTGIRAGIKWVNDLYLGDKKICGILTEAVTDLESGGVQAVIIGIGINLSTEDFPDEIKETAASLFAENLKRNELAAEITRRLLACCGNLSDNGYLEEYRNRSVVIGKEIYYLKNGQRTDARAVGIDDDGGLIVEHADGSRATLSSGEITLRVK